jgi:WD40 repeat protein
MVKAYRLLFEILLLLIAVTCATAQTPLWTHSSSGQSTTDQVVDIALSKNGATVALGDSSLSILNKTGAEFGSFLHANSVGMSTDGTRIAAAMDDGLHIFFPNGTVCGSAGTEPATHVAVSGDGGTIVTGDKQGTLQIYNGTGSKVGATAVIKKESTTVLNLATTRNGSVIAATDSQGLYLYTRAGKVRWKTDFDSPSALALAANGTLVMIGGLHSVLLYNATSTSAEKVGEYDTGGRVDSLATSTDGTRTVVGTENKKVTLLNETGDALWSHPTGDWANLVALSDDASVIAAGSMDKKVQVFFQNGTLRWGYDLSTRPTALAVSGDGTSIGVGCEDGTSYLFTTAITPNKTGTVKNTTVAKNGTPSNKTVAVTITPAKNGTRNNTSEVLTVETVPQKSPMPLLPAVLAALGSVALLSRRRL